MLEVFLEDPGIPFRLNSGKLVRTPIKFIIEDKERKLYESLIRVSPIQNFTITETDKQKPEKGKNNKLLKGKPKIDTNMKLSVNLR